MSILVEKISKIYGQQHALNDVSFEINSGEIVGFLGPNGAGKSTMMKILTGFISQTSGNAFVNGASIIDKSIEVRKNIGYLPEHNPLYLDMYVREHIELIASIYKIKENIKQKINNIIEQTGLTREQHKKVGALSKGYRQRLGLAQALIHNPKVLILDEPTTGLDPNQIVEIRNLISEVGKEKTIMLSTHIMQEVEAICDKIIIINKGVIVANDTVKNIHIKSSKKQQLIEVELNKSVEKEFFESLKTVNKAYLYKNNTWHIESDIDNDNDNDIRSEIFNLAVKNNLTVLSMQKLEKKLEEIFQEYTK